MNRAYSMDWSPNALSPTTTKLALQKSEKKLAKLREELQNEISEKTDLIEENSGLTNQIDTMRKQIHLKSLENERLKGDIGVLHEQLELAQQTSSENSKISTESILLKQDLVALQNEKELLENEIQNVRTSLEKAEDKIQFLTSELTIVENGRQEIQVLLYNQEMEINEWKRKFDESKIEITDLNEYNRTLDERLSQLEARKDINTSLLSENAESLDREFQFQSMRERIDVMTANFRDIENEQQKLMNENDKLFKGKQNLEAILKKLKSEKDEFEKKSFEATEKLNILLDENLQLNEDNRTLISKICDAESIINSCHQKLDCTINEHNECRRKLLVEKQDLESNLLSLSQELHSTTLQLEKVFAENKEFETILQETRTALQDKITALLVMTSHCNEVEKARDCLRKELQDTKQELKDVGCTKNELQKELFSAGTFIEQSAEENSRKLALLEQRVDRHVNELNEVQSLYHKCLTENNELRASVVELTEMNEHQSRLLDDFQNRISCLNAEKEEVETTLNCRISLMEEREKVLRETSQSATEDNRYLRQKVEEWNRRYAEEIEKKKKVEEDLQESIEEKNNLSTRFENIAGQLQSLISERDDLETLKQVVEEHLRKTETENKHLRAQLLAWIRQYDFPPERIHQTDEEIEEWLAEEQNLFNLLSNVSCNLKSIIAESSNLKTTNEHIMQNWQETKLDKERLSADLQQLILKYNIEVEEKSRINKELLDVKAECENHCARLETFSLKLESSIAEIEDLNKTNKNIDRCLLEAKVSNESLQREMQEWIRKHDIEFTERSRLTGEIQNLMDESKIIHAELATLRSERKNSEEALQETETSNEKLRLDVEEWRDKFAVEAEKRSVIDEEMRYLSEENATLLIRLETVSEEFVTLENKLKNVTMLKENYERALQELRIKNENLELELHHLTQKYDTELLEKNRITENMQIFGDTNEKLSKQLAQLTEKLNSQEQELKDAEVLRKELEFRSKEVEASNSSSLLENANLLKIRETLLVEMKQLQKERDELKCGNDRLLESNKEKLLLLKEIEKRVHSVTEEMEELKRSNEELEDSNHKLKERLDVSCEVDLELKTKNAQFSKSIHELECEKLQLTCQVEEMSSKNQSLCSQITSLMQALELKEAEGRELCKLVATEAEDIQALKKNEIELASEMENLQNQNKILRHEVDKLMAHVELFNNDKETECKIFEDAFDVGMCGKNVELKIEKENKSRDSTNEKLEEKNARMQARIEDLLREKIELYEMEKINNEAFHSQLNDVFSKNAVLSSENEELRNSLKSLQVETAASDKKHREIEKKFENLEEMHAEEVEKLVAQAHDERTKLNGHILDKQKREEQLLSQLGILNVKLVEESERVNILQRTHAAQLQKQIEINKLLENKLQHYENNEKDTHSKCINELKKRLEETLESNERLEEELKIHLRENEILIKENENLLMKTEDFKMISADLEDTCKRLKIEKDDLRAEQEALSLRMDSMNDVLVTKETDIDRLKDEYEIFKKEYRKLVQHKDELESEFKSTLLLEHGKLDKKCDQLSSSNGQLSELLIEKDKIIETLTVRIEDLETKACVSSSMKESHLMNETHVVISKTGNEVCMNLRRENLKLMEECKSYKQKQLELEAQLKKEKENYRNKGHTLYEKLGKLIKDDYEGKFQRAKTEYQQKFNEKLEIRERQWKKKEEEYKMIIHKEREHNKDLNSQNWNLMDQCLQMKQGNESRRCSDVFQDNFHSPNSLRKTKSATQLHLLGSRQNLAIESDRRMSCVSDRGTLISESDRCLSAMSTISEDFLLPAAKKRTVTISAKVFPTEDEEQEIFDNACLADLKQGRMPPNDESLDFNKQRLSILQARNSLCPPHLKSSYPAETQFLPPQEFEENEIKLGNPFDDNGSDVENSLSIDRQRKTRNQTSYKKPGPPTPSKNGGRSTAQVETPKKILRDSNDNGTIRRKSFTPKFFNNLFALRGHVNIPSSRQQNDENIPLTPKHTRLSSIRRRFSRQPQELKSLPH